MKSTTNWHISVSNTNSLKIIAKEKLTYFPILYEDFDMEYQIYSLWNKILGI